MDRITTNALASNGPSLTPSPVSGSAPQLLLSTRTTRHRRYSTPATSPATARPPELTIGPPFVLSDSSSAASSATSYSRRQSTPLLPSFMVSAPGKVIVYGEHAVVHQQPAIAAAIALRTYLLVDFLSKSRHTVTLCFPDIGLSHTWDIERLPWSYFERSGKKHKYSDAPSELDSGLLAALAPFVDEVSPDETAERRKIQKSSATAFLYLFLSLGSASCPATVYTLRSTIPTGAGLGSSASVGVCLSCALLMQIRALSGPHPDQLAQEAAINVDRVNNWAFVAEMCIHGNPSGVDNTVSSGGKAVYFLRDGSPPTVKRLANFPELPLLLVNTGVPRSTATQVRNVGLLRQACPRIMDSILGQIGAITTEAHNLLSSPSYDLAGSNTIEYFGRLAQRNHKLLDAIGVSHPRLERVVQLVGSLGWTKLTGAGAGGCAFAILRPTTGQAGPTNETEDSRKQADDGADLDWTEQLHVGPTGRRQSQFAVTHPVIPTQLSQALEAEKFEFCTTTLGGHGVGVLWPAVLHNGNGEDGGEEIDRYKFLNADGTVGIERLVGVSNTGVGNAVGEWKFWDS